MIFLDRLLSHKGGLIRLKTELYWYGGRGYDRSPDRICLLLDAARTAAAAARTAAAALLLIESSPHWVWVAAEDVELLSEKL